MTSLLRLWAETILHISSHFKHREDNPFSPDEKNNNNPASFIRSIAIFTDDPEYVAVGIIPSPLHVNVWILGSIFMQNYYVQFDVLNRQVRMTQHGAKFASFPIPTSEQPSYFQSLYDASFVETFFMLMIFVVSACGLYAIVGSGDDSPSRSIESDDMMLARLLEHGDYNLEQEGFDVSGKRK